MSRENTCPEEPSTPFPENVPAFPEEIYFAVGLKGLSKQGLDDPAEHAAVAGTALDLSPAVRDSTGWEQEGTIAWERLQQRYQARSFTREQLGLGRATRVIAGILVPRSAAIVDACGAPEPLRLVFGLWPEAGQRFRLRGLVQGFTVGVGNSCDPRKHLQTVPSGVYVEQSPREAMAASQILRAGANKDAAIAPLLDALVCEPREPIAEWSYRGLRRLSATQARLLGEFALRLQI